MRRTPLLWILALTGVVWVVLFVVRVQAQQPNVDDYLYADRSAALTRDGPLGYVKGALRSGHISPLVPALAASLARWGGIDQAVLVQLPLLVLLVAGAYLLARTWLDAAPAAAVAVAAGLNQAVLGWSVMLHFGVASTAAVLWAFVTYLRSDHLRRRSWSLGFGLAVGLLALSRSVAPVYVAPLLLVVLVSVVRDRLARSRLDLLPGILAAGVAFVVAAPWWWFSGPTAVDYLVGAGFDPDSDLAGGGIALGPAEVWRRVVWTLSDLGGVQTVALAVTCAAAVAWYASGRTRLPGSLPLVAWVALTTLLLSTSGNGGTGFGLPVLVVVVVLVFSGCVVALTDMPWSRQRPVTLVLVAVVVGLVGAAAHLTGSQDFWWRAAPYRVMVLEAGGDPDTDVREIHRGIASLTAGDVVLMVRDDALLNVPGLSWHRTRLIYVPFGPEATAGAIRDLGDARWLIAGDSPKPYHPSLDQSAVEAAARQRGFDLVRTVELAEGNHVRIWRRG